MCSPLQSPAFLPAWLSLLPSGLYISSRASTGPDAHLRFPQQIRCRALVCTWLCAHTQQQRAWHVTPPLTPIPDLTCSRCCRYVLCLDVSFYLPNCATLAGLYWTSRVATNIHLSLLLQYQVYKQCNLHIWSYHHQTHGSIVTNTRNTRQKEQSESVGCERV